MLIAQKLALQIIRSLAPLVALIEKRDPSLAGQMRRSGSSIVLNLAEGSRRVGRDRPHLYRVAAGSAGEVLGSIEVSLGWGYIAESNVGTTPQDVDRLLAMLYGLTRNRR